MLFGDGCHFTRYCLEIEVISLVCESISKWNSFPSHPLSGRRVYGHMANMPEDCHAALTLACIHCLQFLYFIRMFSNIPPGDKYRAKLTHFCALRRVTIDHTQITSHVIGRFGYPAAEYFRLGPFTETLYVSFLGGSS